MVWITGPSKLMLMRTHELGKERSLGAKIIALKRRGSFSEGDAELLQRILRNPRSEQSAKDKQKLAKHVQKQWEELGLG